MKQLLIAIYFLLPLISVTANDLPFQSGEELMFDIHYKYGLVMVRAGTADFKTIESKYKNKNIYESTLDFKTTSFFDKIFKMRDTLRSQITENLQPLYHKRSVNEGNYQFNEDMFFNKSTPNYSEVRVKREVKQQLRFDTIFTANMITYDMLNFIQFIRSHDYSHWQSTPGKTISTLVGKNRVNVTVRCEGQSIIEKSDTLKYKTYKIALDFTDSAFNESKNAIEIWMSDDQNRIPIKIRAKLRIGAAEVNLTSWKNLKYPFTSEIKIPVRN
jgi:hypothetical protein